MSRFIVARANSIVFGVLVVILLLTGGVTWDQFTATRRAQGWTDHTYQVIGVIQQLNLAVRGAETGQRGFLITGNADYLEPYQEALGAASFLQGELQRLTADNPGQQDRLRQLAPVLQRRLEQLAQGVQMRRELGFEGAARSVATDAGRVVMKQIEASLATMMAEENGLLVQRLAAVESRSVWIRWLVAIGTVVAVMALVWAARMLNQAWGMATAIEREQRAVALRLQASLDSLSQGIGVFDAGRRLINWNECFQVLLDLPRAMVRNGMPYEACTEHVAEDGVQRLETADQIRFGRSTAGEAITYEIARGDGHQLEIRRTPMPDGGFVLTVSDMTRRAQAEAILRESQKMQAVGQLTGGIAHDFNNLLTVILGNLDFARTRLDSEHPLQIRIERATWAAQRGALLTAQLLAFARKQALAPAAIDLAAAMPTMVPLLRRTLGEHIDVRYVETAGLWPAMADPAQLESALLNLALNARDAMPGGGQLTIELANMVLDEDYARRHAEVSAGDYTMLAVSDTGHGMSPEVVARVFEPFFTTKPEGKGTGLGLAMVFGFVKQSGGHVKIYSEPGHGTTVRLYLPRAIGAPGATAQRTGTPVELPRGSANVLLVEDEPAVREIARVMLEDLGYRVLEAASGEEALRVFGANAAAIDLLLTDVVLPGQVRGRELSERLSAMRPEMKVLFMSGYTENSIVHNGRLDDGVHLISKPFKREQLARKVADLMVGGGSVGDENVVELRSRREGPR
jgi:signal transduction histidine kinase/ActR/RegA family two-component response regulator